MLADWAAVVGPALAGVTVPRRLHGGTLTLGCAGPVALELQHRADWVLARVNTYLGGRVAERLRLVQEAPAAVAGVVGPAKVGAEPRLPGVAPGPLRDALAALGRAMPRGAGSRGA